MIRNETAATVSPMRMVGIGIGSALVLAGVGLVVQRYQKTDAPAGSATPSPAVSAAASLTPVPSPSSSPTASPSPSPTTTTSASSLTASAQAAYTDKKYTEAIGLYIKALAAAKTSAETAQLQYELGNAYREAKQSTEALAAYGKATEANPQLVVAYQAKANLYVSQANKNEASTVLKAGLAANPDNTDLKRDLSVLQLSGAGE